MQSSMSLRKAFSWTLLAALPLAALELGARLLIPPKEAGLLAHRPILELYPDLADAESIFNEVSAEMLDWAPYEHFAAKPGLHGKHFSTNSLGLRGPEIAIEKPNGRYRIAVLGGSAAWGYGSSSNATTVAGYLQSILQDEKPDLAIEILNAGQIGYVSTQELIFFHRVVSQLEPDLVVMFDGYNDIVADMINGRTGLPQNVAYLRSRYEGSIRNLPASADLARWLRRSRFLDVAADRIAAAAPAPTDFPEPAATAEAYVRNVQAIARLAAPGRVVVALQPSLATTDKPLSPRERRMLQEKEVAFSGFTQHVRACDRAMQSALAASGTPVIRLDGALGSEPKLLFADECHFGDAAAKRVAQALARALVSAVLYAAQPQSPAGNGGVRR